MSDAHPNSKLVRRFAVDRAQCKGRWGFVVRERVARQWGYVWVWTHWTPEREEALAKAREMGVLVNGSP